jgi:hypothetical protein
MDTTNVVYDNVLTEAKGANAAENLAALKKGEMAERAADLLTGAGWLPPHAAGRIALSEGDRLRRKCWGRLPHL